MLLCIFALGANAQLLWKVSGKGLNKASYVLGTHHLAPLSILDSISGLKQAMNDVEQVCGEVVMEEMKTPVTLMKMQQAAILPGDTTLHTLFTAAQYDSLAVKVKELMGVDLNMFDKMNLELEKAITATGNQPVILCSSPIRLLFRKLVERTYPQIAIMSYNEISPNVKVKSVGMVKVETAKR